MMNRILLMVQSMVIFVMVSLSSFAFAKDLGVFGHIYPIQESDLLEDIQGKVRLMQENGEWENFQNQSKVRMAQHIDRPAMVLSLHKTTHVHSWLYDPSMVLGQDLKDSEGKVFAAAGTRINPLTFKDLHTALVFYDGDDEEQVGWVRKINKKYTGKTKLILVKGSISAQAKIFQQPIYFDQHGTLSARLHISQVPALVAQEGMALRIREIML